MLLNMEPWEISKTDELTKVVTRLVEQKSKLFKKLETEANEKKPEILEKLVQIFDKLKINYIQIEIFSKVDYTTEINDSLKNQIEYYEQGLDILKEKVKVEEIPYYYFLKLARLQYEYFDRNREDFLGKSEKQEGVFFGETMIPQVNSIINTIHLAMKNVEMIIQQKRQTLEFETLYIHFEIYGDLFINIYA